MSRLYDIGVPRETLVQFGFYPREKSNPPYASRVNTTSPEAYHTSPEEENPSGEVKYLELVIVGSMHLSIARW